MRKLRDIIFLITLLLPLEGQAQTATSTSLQAPALSLSTNLLYDVVMAPSLGAEVNLGKNLSLAAHGTWNWFDGSLLYKHVRIVTGDAEVRYWLTKDPAQIMRRGHHVGVYGAVYRYDFYFDNKGDQADLNWGGGLSYGYALGLSSHFSLDFSLAVGFVGGKYRTYEHIDDEYQHDVWTADKVRRYVGPTKAEVSLIWHLF